MVDERMMRCPWCELIFWITEEEQYDNETFECRLCGLPNDGSIEADEFGVLIGVILPKKD